MAIKTPQKKVPKKMPVKSTQAPKRALVKKTTPITSGPGDVQKILETHSKHFDKIDSTLSLLSKELKELKSTIVAVKSSQPVVQQGYAKKTAPDSSWHPLIDPDREYTQKEIIGITKISQPTLSMAKVRGHIVTKEQIGKRGWVVLGSELLKWDNGRAKNAGKKAKKTTKPAVASKNPVSKTVKGTSVSKPAQKALAVPASVKTGKTLAVQKKESKSLAVQPAVKTMKASTAGRKTPKVTATANKAKVVKKPVAKKKSETETNAVIPNDIPARINTLTMKKVVTQTQFGQEVGLPQKVIYEITTNKRKELNPAMIQKISTVLKKYEGKLNL